MNETKTLDLTQFESQDKDKTPNVKKLWSPEVEQETDKLPFDPERDITEEDWEEILVAEINALDSDNILLGIAEHSMEIKILNPNFDSSQYLKEDTRKAISNKLQDYIDLKDWENFVNLAAPIKISGSDIDLKLDKIDWKMVKKYIKDWRVKEEFLGNLVFFGVNVKILNPNIDLGLNGEIGAKILEEINEQLKVFKNNGAWYGFASLAARIKILYPNNDFKLTKKDWQAIFSELEDDRNNNQYKSFSELTMNMTILVAKKIEITDQCFKITMPEKKPSISKTPSLPTKLNLN